MKLLFILFFSIAAHAAAPLTHLVVAEEFLTHFEMDPKPFLLGNVFPDIRYLGNITRGQTHEEGLKFEDILQAPTDFKSGMRLHSFFDEFRENLVVQWNMYEGLEELGGNQMATLLKLIEDEILFDRVASASFIPHFIEPFQEEIDFGISKASIQKWHFFIISYLGKRPSENLAELAKMQRPFFDVSVATIQAWSQQLPLLAKEEKYINYVDNLMNAFRAL